MKESSSCGLQSNNMPSDNDQKYPVSGCCSPYHRFVALIFIVISSFSYYCVYDMPASMETIIEEKFTLSPYVYELMYSVYSLPNIVICFFGGLILDKVWGLRRGSLIFSIVAFSGQLIVTAGGFANFYWLMLLGRFVNGVGSETVSLSLSCYAVTWFKGKELNFVFGLFLSITRIGSSFGFLVFTPLYHYIKTTSSDSNAFGLSILIFLVLALIIVTSVAALGHFSKINGKNVDKLTDDEGSAIDFKQILRFRLLCWIIILMLSFANNTVFGFISISQTFLQEKYNLSVDNANYLISLFNIITALASPSFGLAVDKIGKNLYFNFFGLCLSIVSQIIMAASSRNPAVPIIMYALFFALLNSSAWTLVSKVVEPYQLATAYGTMQCCINLVGTANNILVGYLLSYCGVACVTYLLLSSLIFSALCCVLIWYLDKRDSGVLNL